MLKTIWQFTYGSILLTSFAFLKSRIIKLWHQLNKPLRLFAPNLKPIGNVWRRLFGKKEVEPLNKPLRLFAPKWPMIILISLIVVSSALLLILGWYYTVRITEKLVFAIGVDLVLLGMSIKIISLLLKEAFTIIPKVHGAIILLWDKRIYREYEYKLPTGESEIVKRGWETTEGLFPIFQKLLRGAVKLFPVDKSKKTFVFKRMTWLCKDGEIDFDLVVTGKPANLHQLLEVIGEKQDFNKLEKLIEVTLNALAKTMISDKTVDQARNQGNKLNEDVLEKLSKNELHWGFNLHNVLVEDAGVSEEMTKAIAQKSVNQKNAEAIAASFEVLGSIPVLKTIGKNDPKALAKIQMGLIGKGKYDTQNFDITGLSPKAVEGLRKLAKNIL